MAHANLFHITHSKLFMKNIGIYDLNGLYGELALAIWHQCNNY